MAVTFPLQAPVAALSLNNGMTTGSCHPLALSGEFVTARRLHHLYALCWARFFVAGLCGTAIEDRPDPNWP